MALSMEIAETVDMEKLLVPQSTTPVPDVRSVLVLAPHPDDEVFGCGGAVALHVAAGAQVHVVVLTSGHMVGNATVREQESRAAATVLGCPVPEFWELPDGALTYGEALVLRIQNAIVAFKAALVYAPSLWENHPDHRAVAMAVLEAARRSGGCGLMAYEVGAPLRPNLLVDITKVAELKRAAMATFTSQLAVRPYITQIEALNTFRTYTLPSVVEAAEAFEYLDEQTLKLGSGDFLRSEYQRQRAKGLMILPRDAALVSVMIRSVDRPELDRALDSIAAQTWPRIEVVITNAKGTGHRLMPAWCGRFPMRFIDGDAPLQRSEAANRCLDHATGETLLFLDDDDWLDAGHVSKLATALQQDPGAVAAMTGTRGIDAQGNLLLEWPGNPSLHRMMLANQMPIMSVLFRHSGSAERIRFDDSFGIYEDWDFWLQLSLTGRLTSVPGVSANYLIRSVGGSDVHSQLVARKGLEQIRSKWRGRWPDAWLDALQVDSTEYTQALITVTRLEQELRHFSAHAQEKEEEFLRLRNVAEQQKSVAEHKCATITHQLAACVQRIDEERLAAEVRMHEILQSRSWRITAAFRAASSLLARLRRSF